MSEQNNPDEAIFEYRDNQPGVITSHDGLHVGQHVVIYYKGQRVNVHDIIRFDNCGYIKRIELNNHDGGFLDPYHYRVDAIGAGPVNGYGYTYYTDGEPDDYLIKFWDRAEHSDYVRFNSEKPIIYRIHWDPKGKIIDGGRAERWMTDNSYIRGLTLDKITMLGAHDAGMSQFQFATTGGTKANTITQVCDIGQQLNLGVRYFDIRPVYRNGEFYCGHFSNKVCKYLIGWQGACGQSLAEIVNQINEFCRDKKELIILDISGQNGTYLDISNDYSFNEFDENIWNHLCNKFYEVNDLCHYNTYLLCDDITKRKTIGELTAEKSAVVIITGHGDFCKTDNLKIFNDYSGTDDCDKMINDQFNKMMQYANNPNELFLLSWTLTLQGVHNIDGSKILDLAEKANCRIDEITNKVRQTKKYPNIIYIDKIGDAKGFYVTEEINNIRRENSSI